MEHPDRPAVVVAGVVIAHLRQSVLAWIDADRVLPADGSCLLAILDRSAQRLTGSNASAARDEIEAFIDEVQALISTGVLEADDGDPLITAAAAVGALLPSDDEIDSEPRSRRKVTAQEYHRSAAESPRPRGETGRYPSPADRLTKKGKR
jgi:hypothetical protein